MEIIVPRNKAMVLALSIAGLAFAGIDLALFGSKVEPAMPIVLLVIATVVLSATVPPLLSRAPALRATAAGVAFGGRAPIPWREIKLIYIPSITTSARGVPVKPQAVSIDFHHKRTLLRTPLACWFASPFSVGDVDVRAGAASIDALASRLEAMRADASTTATA